MRTLKLLAAAIWSAIGMILFVGAWIAGLTLEAHLLGL